MNLRLKPLLKAAKQLFVDGMGELQSAEQCLREVFERRPYTRNELLGNAACGRKIRALIIAHILKREIKEECVEAMRSLMIESGVPMKGFDNEIVPYIDAYYKAKEIIDKGYCNDLMK